MPSGWTRRDFQVRFKARSYPERRDMSTFVENKEVVILYFYVIIGSVKILLRLQIMKRLSSRSRTGSCTCRQRIMLAGVNRVNSSPFTVVKGDAIMTPNVLFEQLLVVALVLICLLMHVWGPSSRSSASQRPFKPAKPRHKRAKAHKPLTRYYHKQLIEAFY